MIYSWLAAGVVLLHLAFVAFVVAGGFLVWRWPRLAWLHLPAFLWGAWVELAGWVCPLTPLEGRLRRLAGGSGYEGSFVEHHLLPLLYPERLTRRDQVVLGLVVLVLNAVIYAVAARRALADRRRRGAA